MDTFEDTLTNEDYARILHNPPPDSRDLSLLHEAARIWEGFIGYHSYPNPFDCIENDTELMDGFFGWLDEVVLNLNTVKSVKQQSSEFGVKFIKVVNTFERSTRFQLMVTMFQAWKFYLVWERIESKPVITDIKEDFFCFLLVIKCHTVCFQPGDLLVYRVCLFHCSLNSSVKLLIF